MSSTDNETNQSKLDHTVDGKKALVLYSKLSASASYMFMIYFIVQDASQSTFFQLGVAGLSFGVAVFIGLAILGLLYAGLYIALVKIVSGIDFVFKSIWHVTFRKRR